MFCNCFLDSKNVFSWNIFSVCSLFLCVPSCCYVHALRYASLILIDIKLQCLEFLSWANSLGKLLKVGSAYFTKERWSSCNLLGM